MINPVKSFLTHGPLKVELIVWWQNCVKSTEIKGQKVKK